MSIGGRTRLLALALVAALLTVAMPASRSASAATEPRAAEFEFFTLLNESRSSFGKATLQRDPGLDQLALDWSGKMADVYDITHTVLDTSDRTNCSKSALCHRPNLGNHLTPIEPAWLAGGENVGTGGTVVALNDAFIASPGHFANIVGDYNRVGVGVVVRHDRIWITFNFLRGPSLSNPTPPPTSATQAVVVPGGPRGLPVVPVGSAGYFRPTEPVRVLDTRGGLRGSGPIPDHSVFQLSLADIGARPADAFGAALNVTAVDPATDGYLTVYPCGEPPPSASNINFTAGGAIPNLVTVAFGPGQTVCVYTSTRLHLLADLAGWLGNESTVGATAMTTMDPVRVLDSRGTPDRASVFTVSLAGRIAPDASAASLNVTITDPSASGFLTVYPCGSAAPVASNVNFKRAQTVPNLATVALGPNQTVCFSADKPTHLIVDLNGYFAPAGGLLNPVVPDRLLDTREGVGGWLGRLAAEQTVEFKVDDLPGMPADVSGLLLNVTVVDAAAPGYVTLYPCGGAVPTASNLNFDTRQTVANLGAVHVPVDGRICLFSSARVHLLADLQAVVTPVLG